MSVQKIISGKFNSLHNTNTEYMDIYGEGNWGLTEELYDLLPFAVAGTLGKLRVRLQNAAGTATAPDSGETFTFVIRKNQVNTALTIIIDDSNPDGQDLTNEVSFAAEDLISLKCVPSSGNSSTLYAAWSLEFTPTTSGESIYFNAGSPWYGNQSAGYVPFVPTCSNPHAYTETEMQQYIAVAGVIKTLRLEIDDAPGTAPQAYRLTLRKNGANTSLTVTIEGTETTGSDLAHEVAVSPGDLVCWYVEPLNTPDGGTSARFGFCFEAANVDESLFCNGFGTTATPILNEGATAYYPLSHRITSWYTTERTVRQLVQLLTVKDLYLRVSVAPGAGKSWTFTVMKNGVATDLEVVIADAATTGTDLVNEAVFLDDDWVSLRCVPSGTPADANAYWGAMQTSAIAPAVTTQAATDIEATTATGNGNVTVLGDPAATQHGHCWNTTGTPTTADSKTEEGIPATGAFTSSLTGLSDGTKYYVRAYITNAGGTVYGNEIVFTAGAVVYPSDAVTRVTSLIHRYNRGVYDMIVGFGEVIADAEIPEIPPSGTTQGVIVTPIPGSEPVIVYHCPYCDETFSTLAGVEAHIQEEHP